MLDSPRVDLLGGSVLLAWAAFELKASIADEVHRVITTTDVGIIILQAATPEDCWNLALRDRRNSELPRGAILEGDGGDDVVLGILSVSTESFLSFRPASDRPAFAGQMLTACLVSYLFYF